MKIRTFLDQVQHDRIHQAIQAAEAGTSARIVVYIGHRPTTDPMATAHRLFRKIGLETAEQREGLLLFVAPKSRKFAVLGGTLLHEKLGQHWWQHLAGLIAGHFKEQHYTEGLLAAIREAGQAFHSHFSSDLSRPGNHPDIYEK